MVANRVKRATAPTRTCRESKVQTETTHEDEDPEEVGRVRKLGGVGYGGEARLAKGPA